MKNGSYKRIRNKWYDVTPVETIIKHVTLHVEQVEQVEQVEENETENIIMSKLETDFYIGNL